MELRRKCLRILLCLLLVNTATAQNSETVFEFTDSLSRTETSYLTAESSSQPQAKSRTGLTLCTWVRLSYFRRPTVIFSLKDSVSDNWEASLAIIPSGLLLKIKEDNYVLPRVNSSFFLPLDVYHLCLSLSVSRLNVFCNGNNIQSLPSTSETLLTQNITIFAGGGERWPTIVPRTAGLVNLVNSSFPDSVSPLGSFSGSFIGLSLWEELLSTETILALNQCESIPKNPASTDWLIQGSSVKRSLVPGFHPCEINAYNYFISLQALTFTENINLCRSLELTLLTANENGSYNSLLNELESSSPRCVQGNIYGWIQESDDLMSQIQFGEFSCKALTDSGTTSIPCEEKLCSGCSITSERKLFTLRGFCHVNERDLSFVIHKNKNNLGYYFHGIEMYNIIQDGKLWKLRDELRNQELASTSISETAAGLREWRVQTAFCGRKRDTVVQAILSSCSPSEAICNDGYCIPSSKRCDSFPDCSDASDEVGCQSVRFPESYSSSPPPPLPVQISAKFDIIKIISMLMNEPVRLHLQVQYEWLDPRIQLANLNQESKHHFKSQKLWRPRICSVVLGRLINHNGEADDGEDLSTSRSRSSFNTTIGATTLSQPLMDTRDSFSSDRIFWGRDANLSSVDLFTSEAECQFDYTFFPFDEHICQMVLATPWSSSRVVFTSPIMGRYTGPIKLLHYTIMNTKFTREDVKINGEDHSGVLIQIHLDRRTSLLVLIVYLPTVLLVILNSTTLWMTGLQGTFARVQIGCIILIVIMLDWLLLAKYAPLTGHLTAIDAWLCFCTIFSLLHIGVHVLLDIFAEETEPDPYSRLPSRISSAVAVRDVKPVDGTALYDGLVHKVAQAESAKMWSLPYWILFIARVVSPVLLIFFNTAYWPFVLYFSRAKFT